MKKEITTLVDDIYALLKDGQDISDELLDEFAGNMRELMKSRLSTEKRRSSGLRMSQIGKPLRQLWYENQGDGIPREELRGNTLFKFLYGDILEEVTLFLTKCAGHTVEDEQQEVSLNGILGHIDAKIDGHLVDVKSASKFSFRKFADGTLAENDAFGYMHQLSGYAESDELKGTLEGSGFLAINKETGDLALMPVDLDELEMHFPSVRIDKAREALESNTPPPKCYDPEPMGKSGNMKLGVNCSYCPFKKHCWKDANNGKGLRTFIYSTGPVFLTEVTKEPNVPEAI